MLNNFNKLKQDVFEFTKCVTKIIVFFGVNFCFLVILEFYFRIRQMYLLQLLQIVLATWSSTSTTVKNLSNRLLFYVRKACFRLSNSFRYNPIHRFEVTANPCPLLITFLFTAHSHFCLHNIPDTKLLIEKFPVIWELHLDSAFV